MFAEGFSYPHPVLGLEDDIAGDFNCSIKVERNSENRRLRFYEIKYEVSNMYIQGLINSNKAGLLVKLYCSSTFNTWTFINPGESFEIDENDLFGKIEISIFIVAKEGIHNYKDESFHEQFGKNSFELKPNEVIAISGKIVMKIEKTDEKLGLGNIFKFHSRETDTPVEFTFGQNKINIHYPVDKSGNHPPNSLFKTNPWTAYNMFIVPALTAAFSFIEGSSEESVEDYEWYRVISSLLPEDQWSSDPYVNAQRLLKEGIPILKSHDELTN